MRGARAPLRRGGFQTHLRSVSHRAANLLHNEPTLEEYLSRASVRKLEEIRKFPKASPGRTVGDFLGSPTKYVRGGRASNGGIAGLREG